ncbi:MAG: DUF1249 domain-containing protein [Gammaproteobacteria bacterium]|nr:DUF1249 domain-containing protein [Gammaproteobacteria bacterium]
MFGGRIGEVGLQKAGRKRYSIDLNAHMAMCEANYARLMRLMRMLDDRDRSAFAMTLGESEPHVVLRVVARYKYTTEVELSQHHGSETESETAPETKLAVRLYHDAKCAEVVAFQDQRAFRAVYGYPNRQMRHPDEKVQVNRFLGEFLHMCATHGISLEQPDSGGRFDGLRVTLRA